MIVETPKPKMKFIQFTDKNGKKHLKQVPVICKNDL